ncbi:helix-turn-helix domain-containing protein [Microbacterium sp. TPU 3598]|uniref:helix-turn-helix domain-containing protein n=1 Tax=Microbacterium sp. TPU 3598 TaxID=1938334 RepID=UPI000BBAA77B
MWDLESAKRFGAGLRTLRQSHHFTQEQFAYRAGITKNQVQLLEAGRGSGKAGSDSPANPTLATVVGLATGLQMSVAELFSALEM